MFVFALVPLCTHGNIKLTRLQYQQFCNLEPAGGWVNHCDAHKINNCLVFTFEGVWSYEVPKWSWWQVLPAVFHIYAVWIYSSDNSDIFWCVIGLSFLDLSNTSRDEEFPRDECSWGVEGSGDTMLLHDVVGWPELTFCCLCRVLLCSQITVWYWPKQEVVEN
jgi:hypothetical protein